MTRRRHFAVGISVLATTALVGVLATSQGAGAQNPSPGSAPVNIVSPLPLPVTGSIDLAPGGAVTIANPSTNPVPVRDVDAAAREPFQVAMVSTAFSGSSSNTVLVTVPAGKRLVIEHVSAWVNASGANGLASLALSGKPGEFDQIVCHPTGATGNGLNHFFACGNQTKFYADAGSEVTVFLATADSEGGFYRAFISGYYEPVS